MNRPWRGLWLAALAGAALAGGAVAAQPRSEATNLADFDFMVAEITANYAGYDTKVTDATRPALEALTRRLRARAATADDGEMPAIVGEWMAFFHDGHTHAGFIAKPPSTASAARDPADRYAGFTESGARAALAALGDRRDPVEGIWRIGGDRYRLAVLRKAGAAGTFEAVVLTSTTPGWSAGDIKAILTRGDDGRFAIDYRSGDRSALAMRADLVAGGEALASDHLGAWSREWPPVADPGRFDRLFGADDLALTRVSARTLWLRLPDFDDSRAAPLLALLKQRAADLRSTPNLIVDLRNNAGGSDYVYAPLLPLLFTRPIYSIGVEMRATRDNAALRRALADRIRAEAPEQATELYRQADLMEHHLGEYLSPDSRPFSSYAAPAIAPSPRRIVVLIDGAASSGEQFLLDARQSRKVTLMGKTNSAGVLDFANVVATTSPSGRLALQWATSRSLRLPDDPVDPVGVAPDIRIPATVEDPIAFAATWLERQVD